MSAIELRPFNYENDKSFIYSTMLKGVYFGSDMWRDVPASSFYAEYAKVIDDVLAEGSCDVVIASLAGDSDSILGYAILGFGVVHWVHVKEQWRKKGIARLLLGSSVFSFYSQKSKAAPDLAAKKGLTYDPFMLLSLNAKGGNNAD